MKDLPNLDFIRAFAVLLVVISHTLIYMGHVAWVGWAGTVGVGNYLGHAFAIVIAIHLLAAHSLILRVAAYFAVLVVAPVAFYHLLERPMIVLGSKLARKIERGPSPRMNENNLSLETAP